MDGKDARTRCLFLVLKLSALMNSAQWKVGDLPTERQHARNTARNFFFLMLWTASRLDSASRLMEIGRRGSEMEQEYPVHVFDDLRLGVQSVPLADGLVVLGAYHGVLLGRLFAVFSFLVHISHIGCFRSRAVARLFHVCLPYLHPSTPPAA
jgi:hypothetical protein